MRRAIGADVEAFASPEERVLETIPCPVRGAVSKGKEEADSVKKSGFEGKNSNESHRKG
ncbi:MAG: hypothetical protein GXY09_06245 [Bacteroidales bacterium]|nr:hypothetical protein [Bacteroidales bacterium]